MHLPNWAIALIAIYGGVALILFIGFLSHNHGCGPSKGPGNKAVAPRQEFASYLGDFLFVIFWPVFLVLTPPKAVITKFLYTPGNTCFGMSCLPKKTPPAAPAVRSDEHNMEAGLAAPEVVTVPPSAALVEMRPVAKSSDEAGGAPPPYQAGNAETVAGQAA